MFYVKSLTKPGQVVAGEDDKIISWQQIIRKDAKESLPRINIIKSRKPRRKKKNPQTNKKPRRVLKGRRQRKSRLLLLIS